MKVLQSIMRDEYFRLRTRAFTNGVFLDEQHVHFAAANLMQELSNTYGATSVLTVGHKVVLGFKLEDGHIVISRGWPEHDVHSDPSITTLIHSGNGYIALHEGQSDAIIAAMAYLSEGASDRQAQEDNPLLTGTHRLH